MKDERKGGASTSTAAGGAAGGGPSRVVAQAHAPRPEVTLLSDDDDSSDDGIVILDQAPPHMRPAKNKHKAAERLIVLDSSDSDSEPVATRMHHKRGRSTSGDVRNADQIKHTRRFLDRVKGHGKQAAGAKGGAGPSRAADTVPVDVDMDSASDSEREGGTGGGDDSDLGGPSNNILPKPEYLVPVVQDIIPDIDPDWVLDQIAAVMEEIKDNSNAPGQDAVDRVVNAALEMDPYPRVGGAEAEPADPEDEGDYIDPTHRQSKRVGDGYNAHSMAMLEAIFTKIPVSHIRQTFLKDGGKQLVPAYQILHRQATAPVKAYHELKKRRSKKGKQRSEVQDEDSGDERMNEQGQGEGYGEAHRERIFLRGIMKKAVELEQLQVATEQAKQQEEADRAQRRELAIAAGSAIECGCCFDSEAMEDLAACPDGHFFCHDCLKGHAESKLGEQKTIIPCMDMSGCQELFTDVILQCVLSEKTMSLYHRLRQYKDLEDANIDGLESCPHCPYAIVIENQDEKLFHCLNDDCRKVTCRKCKRPDHIPRRCEEMDEDRRLNKRHAVEEAMSNALMRKCPKCAKPYIKESGCNKITCQTCATISCYICQKAIPEGYAHFDQLPGSAAPRNANKCRLWDAEEKDMEVERIVAARDEAARRLIDDAAKEGEVLMEEDIAVDAPNAPLRAAAAPRVPAGAGAAGPAAAARPVVGPGPRVAGGAPDAAAAAALPRFFDPVAAPPMQRAQRGQPDAIQAALQAMEALNADRARIAAQRQAMLQRYRDQQAQYDVRLQLRREEEIADALDARYRARQLQPDPPPAPEELPPRLLAFIDGGDGSAGSAPPGARGAPAAALPAPDGAPRALRLARAQAALRAAGAVPALLPPGASAPNPNPQRPSPLFPPVESAPASPVTAPARPVNLAHGPPPLAPVPPARVAASGAPAAARQPVAGPSAPAANRNAAAAPQWGGRFGPRVNVNAIGYDPFAPLQAAQRPHGIQFNLGDAVNEPRAFLLRPEPEW